MPDVPIALQLYTVRDELARDFEGTLRRVAEIGYTAVEFAGFLERPASKLYAILKELNLQVAGAHVPVEDLETDLEAIVEYHLEIGNQYLVVPSAPEERRRDRKRFRSFAHALNDIGADIQDYGLKICYHNHAYELEDFGGQTGMEILLETTEPETVGIELDTYWIKYGGADPAELLRRLAGRCPLVHLKDMADDEQRSTAEIGTGTMDFDAIFAAAEEAGVQWYIVEQDETARPSLESARISLENLKARGKSVPSE